MTSLPLDLVDKIITVNANLVVSNYLAAAKPVGGGATSSVKNKKKKATTESASKRPRTGHRMKGASSQTAAVANPNPIGEESSSSYVSRYLVADETVMKFYRQSSWLKFLLPIPPASQKKRKKNPTIHEAQAAINKIEEIAYYFNLLETHYKHQPIPDVLPNKTIDVRDASSMDATMNIITKLENILDEGGYSQERLEKNITALEKYYSLEAGGLPSFVILVLMLRDCGYIPSSASSASSASSGSSAFTSQPATHIFLEMIIRSNLEEIEEFKTTYIYYNASYKFIPLLSLYLGMGYSFVIGWDIPGDGLIGITENGSDGHEVMRNSFMAYGWLSQPKRMIPDKGQGQGKPNELKQKHNEEVKNRKLEDFMKMLGCRDISILLEESRRLGING